MSEQEIQDESEVYAIRKQKLVELRETGFNFPNQFRRDSKALELHQAYESLSKEELEEKNVRVKIAGRIVLRRIMGKASFIHIQDVSGRIQAYVRKNNLREGLYAEFKQWDLGDIVGVEGTLFKTNTGELSVFADNIELLTKSLRPLPDKFHGLTDLEMRYRQRYVDLIANEQTRKIFETRTKIVSAIREFMNQREFLEVETPMMHPIPGGALAKPFITHHNSLDMQMYLRIAPELYLKRLVVGGFERVYEINRNFRNEGLSTQHNPEFTMLEFYQAFADYKDLIELTESMLRSLCAQVLDSEIIDYQGQQLDFSKPFARMTVLESILHFNSDISQEQLEDIEQCKALAKKLGIELKDSYGLGKLQIEIFEKTVEDRLIQPTFITEYPTEVSPLARRSDDNPFVTDRFEFFVAGREIANGFSELNDAEDQESRFKKQVQDKEAGDDEAMHFDSDYINALEYGLPPTAGEGIGIDRLVMLFTDAPSIRDVILFPHMRRLED
jgi:lysyl-tRNA synthetase class 2